MDRIVLATKKEKKYVFKEEVIRNLGITSSLFLMDNYKSPPLCQYKLLPVSVPSDSEL